MERASYYIHDLDPMAFHLGNWGLPWYWLVYGLGFVWTLWFTRRMNQTYGCLASQLLLDYLVLAWFAMLLMARCVYVFLYFPSYYLENPDQVIAIWQGGMSFHGGMLGIYLAAWWMAHKRDLVSPWVLTDLVALAVPALLFFGRIANFINGELAGRVTEQPWGVIFPRYGDQLPRHPSQLYEAVGEGVFLGILVIVYRSKLRQPGFLSGLFLIGYGLVRFMIEFFREPDPQLGYLLGGLTMGQLLCSLMIGCGLFLLYRSHGRQKRAASSPT